MSHLFWTTSFGSISFITLILAILFSTSAPFNLDTLLPSPSASKTALLLTAHPDDEAMFFSPTIISLIDSSWGIRGLCFSIGNGFGLGALRRKESFASYEILGVPPEMIEVIDHPELPDSMSKAWDGDLIATILKAHLERHPVSLIITFDLHGITRHPNHISLPKALSSLPHHPNFPRILMLRSPSIYTKFTGPLYPILYTTLDRIQPFLDGYFPFRRKAPPAAIVIISSPSAWWTGIRAMLQHRSQLVWFRWLYLGFSRLMWMNELI